MGILYDVRCETCVIPSSGFSNALAALKSLAADRPEEFHEADAVLAAPDLLEALDADGWSFERDEAGLKRLWYGGDKAPYDSDEFWPESILEALASSAASGQFEVFLDGDLMWRFTLHDGVLHKASLGR